MHSKLRQILTLLAGVLIVLAFTACSKNVEERFGFSGTVYNSKGFPVEGASIEIYPTPNDWMTGHNLIKKLVTDANGRYESNKAYEAGDYYIFVEKRDSTNWNIRDVENGIFPKVTLPQASGNHESVIDYTSMNVIANTRWVLVNVMREYSKPNNPTREWLNVWNVTNNCKKDNYILFDNTTKFLKSEGQYLCGNENDKKVRFSPPLVMSILSCMELPNTSVLVKEIDYYEWPEFKDRDGRVYMSCDQSVGQLFLYFINDQGQRTLEVYSRS